MKRRTLLLIIFVFLGITILARAAQVACSLSLASLQCEGRENPLGVDEPHPRLSWRLESARRDEVQTAYQVLVSSSAKLLLQNRGDLWDSGEVKSDETVNVDYAGSLLASSQQVFWKTRVWDKDGKISEWSSPAAWTAGLLNREAWHAQWISADGAEKYAVFYPEAAHRDFNHRETFAQAHPHAVETAEPNYSSLLARREFATKTGLIRAVVYVCGLGQYELSVNGRKIGEALLSPGWTDYRKTALYDSYDITPQISTGRNAIGLIISNGVYNIQPDYVRYVKYLNSYGPLKAIAQLRLDYADGTVETIGTDKTWQVSPGPVTYSNEFGGEDYDARRVQAGWAQPFFQPEKSWSAALEIEGPGGVLRGISAAALPIKAMAKLLPIKRTQLNANTWVYDLGQNASIMPHLRVRGPRGSSVRMTPAELIDGKGAIDRRSATQDGVRPAWWQYTLGSDAVADWKPQFFYQGGRYLQVEFFPAPNNSTLPIIEKLEGSVVQSSAASIGEFSSSNELFNRIYQLVRWAQRSNMMSILTDCPHREKLGWLEQYHLNGPSLRYNFELSALFRKGMNDMADSQLENGFVPNIAPEFFIAGPEDLSNGFRNSPEWGSSFIIVPWQQCLFTGDTALIRDYYVRMKRYLVFLESTAKDNIIPFGLGDWYDLGPKPPWGSQLTPVPFTATAIYYYDHCLMAEMAKRIGRLADAEEFSRRAQAIRESFNRTFFKAESATYATGSQTCQAMPLFFGLVEPENRKRVTDLLVADIRARGNSFTSGDVGYRFLLQALAMEGRSDVIFDMNNQTDKPGYGYQLKMGATSLTEKWDAGVGSFGSQNHFMLGQINEWFFHDLAGIQPDESGPGFKKIIIKPAIVGDLLWVKASYQSVHGQISSAWQRSGNRLTLTVTIPPNSSALVYVPTARPDSVTESGSPARAAPGIAFLRAENGCALFEVGSGTYVFVARTSG